MRATLRPLLLSCALLLPSSTVLSVDFDREILPLLADRCFACHGPDAAARKAKLRLDVREMALRVLAPGTPAESELLRRVTATDLDDRMPPPSSPKRLGERDVLVLRQWIEQGAVYSTHWAFVPPVRQPAPLVEDTDWAGGDIDRFVLARLEERGLAPSPSADPQTLVRRATLDLTGLPSTPEEIDAFLDDDSPDAWETLLDRLLESPRFGEHMATYWLETARYADTDGYQNDRYRYMHPWRDWVIKAFNENKPLDEFIIEQLAGDMLPDATLEQQIATGFGRNHRINSEAGSIPDEWHVENVVDRVDTLGTVFLGLTIGCARCHEHKYDPVTQREYYRLFAFFNNVPEWGIGPNNGNSPPFIRVPDSWPDLSPGENRLIPPASLEFQKGQYGGGVVRPRPGDEQTVMVLAEMEEPRPTYLLRRGQYNLPDTSEALAPGVPASLDVVPGERPGNRLGLARWLVRPTHPLTARVFVNRYWQRFFGTGLVKTSENFGSQGERPSHPELLDWLATELVRTGWDVKRLCRTILSTKTYRQSSRVTPELLRIDPENRLLARGPRFRLHAAVLRDQALHLAGLLVERFGGPSAKPYMPPKIWRSISNNKYVQDHGENLYRRSLYTYWRRTIPPPTMLGLDAAEREICLVRKERTNTPLQALTLMNNIAFVEASRLLASRMIREGGDCIDDRLGFGFRLATGRRPSARELDTVRRAHAAFGRYFESSESAGAELLGVGEWPREDSIAIDEHAAMTLVASTILNLDETITKE